MMSAADRCVELEDEIEELRAEYDAMERLKDAEIERLQAEMDTDHVQHMLNIKRKDAKIERLRAALERIWNEYPYEDGAEIARGALRDD